MVDLVIRPTIGAGNKIIIKDQAGDAVITTEDSGATIANASLTAPAITGKLSFSDTPQAMTSAGAVSLTTTLTTVASSSAITLTLANGTQGQIKIIVFITDGGNVTLMPSTMVGGTTLTFADVGDSAILMWIGVSGWQVIGGWGPGTPGAGPTIG